MDPRGSGGSRAPPASEFRDQGPESQEGGVSRQKNAKTGPPQAGLQGLQGPPGASRGLLQGSQGASRLLQGLHPGPNPSKGLMALQTPPGPPGASGVSRSLQGPSALRPPDVFQPKGPVGPCSPQFRSLKSQQTDLRQGASSRGLGGLQEPLTSFKLSGLSTYANEEVLLLTKMDLTEFRS